MLGSLMACSARDSVALESQTMRLLSIALIVLLIPAVPLKAGESNEGVWERLVRRSKGVNVAKLQTAGLAR